MSTPISRNPLASTLRSESQASKPTSGASLQKLTFALFFSFTCLSIFWFLQSHEASRGSQWFADAGFVLNTADKLLKGKHLYSDLFYQYGPIPIESYVVWCKSFGNSISSLYAFSVPLLLIWWLLLFQALKKAEISTPTTIVVLLTVSLSVLSPSYIPDVGLYHPFEEILIMLVMILWEAPSRRTMGRGIAIGFVIGMMQWVRFGAATGMLAGVFALDLLSEKATLRSRLKSMLPYIGAFLAIEISLAGWLFFRYSTDIMADVLWPYFMAASYDAYPAIDRLPRLTTLNFFLGTQLMALICGLLAVAGLFWQARRRQVPAEMRLLLLAIAYIVYAAIYYKQVWHFYGGTWMLCAAAAPAINSFSIPRKMILCILFLPGFFIGARSIFFPAPSPRAFATLFPNGESLWIPQPLLDDTNFLVKKLQGIESTPEREGVMFLSRRPASTVGSHFYYFYRLEQPVRHAMIFPGWLRERDSQMLPGAISRSKALVLFQDPTDLKPPSDACVWEGHPYPHPACDLLTQHLTDPIMSDKSTWIFPLK